jgi:hypothetical protein
MLGKLKSQPYKKEFQKVFQAHGMENIRTRFSIETKKK